MRIIPGNFFIMRGVESYYVEHKIDGDLHLTSRQTLYGDVVAVLMPDDTVRVLPNAVSSRQEDPNSTTHHFAPSRASFDRFRYDPEAQLKLLQDNPEIDPDKWTPIRQWTGQLLEALPSLELAEIVVAAR